MSFYLFIPLSGAALSCRRRREGRCLLVRINLRNLRMIWNASWFMFMFSRWNAFFLLLLLLSGMRMRLLRRRISGGISVLRKFPTDEVQRNAKYHADGFRYLRSDWSNFRLECKCGLLRVWWVSILLSVDFRNCSSHEWEFLSSIICSEVSSARFNCFRFWC